MWILEKFVDLLVFIGHLISLPFVWSIKLIKKIIKSFKKVFQYLKKWFRMNTKRFILRFNEDTQRASEEVTHLEIQKGKYFYEAGRSHSDDLRGNYADQPKHPHDGGAGQKRRAQGADRTKNRRERRA
jgi:hypothetical protein